MLIYSVYSNYKFLAYYTKPNTLSVAIVTFIPALLLDIGCIFFLSLSQDNKSLNFHTEKAGNLYKNLIDIFNKKNKKSNANSIDLNIDLNDSTNKSIDKKSCLKNNKIKTAENIERVNNGNKKEEEKKDKIIDINTDINSDIKKVKTSKENISGIKLKKITKNSSNKIKNSDIKKVKNYIKKLVENGIEKIKIEDLKTKCKIDKNRWLEIKDILVNEGILYISENKRNTFCNMKLGEIENGRLL